MNPCYKAFGLRIVSEIAFPELELSTGTPDVLIERSSIPIPTFSIPGVGKFHIPDDQHVFFEGDNLSAIRPFILGTAMGILLQKRGYLVLHGNAIVEDDHCIVFIGPSGAGKSTLAASFIQTGYQILSDDVCAIRFDPEPRVVPGYPQIKLWKDSAELLGYGTTQLRPLFERQNKFAINLDKQFCTTPKKIRQIYLLGGSEKFALIQNTYRLQFIETPEERARHLKQCQMLLKHCPVKLLSRPPLPGAENSFKHWVSNSLC